MRDAAFTLSAVNTDRMVFTGSMENNGYTVASIAFEGSRPAGEQSAQSGKSQMAYILPMPPAASPSGDILGRWREAANGIERERAQFSDDLRTNTTISMTSMTAGLGALAWGLIDFGMKGSVDTFNTVLMGAGGGVAAVSLTVGLIVEDGLKQRLQNKTGELERLKKELMREYPDSFAARK